MEITTRKILDASGRLVGQFDCPQVLTAWERVYRVLRDAFPRERYHRGRGVSGFVQTENSVVAHFGDGDAAEAELLVGADGLRSTIRQQCLPELAPLYVGYVAWRALIPEAAFAPAIHRELFNYMTFCLPPGEQCLGYPVAGPDNDLRPGHRRYNVVWYRPADENGELQHLLTDAGGTTHTISIPPPLIRREAIAQMRAAAERLLAPQFREVVRMIDEPILQPIYDLETPRMAFGRVAMIGDAGPGRKAHHRARATSRRLSPGHADRRGARPLAASQHSPSGAGRDRGARLLAELMPCDQRLPNAASLAAALPFAASRPPSSPAPRRPRRCRARYARSASPWRKPAPWRRTSASGSAAAARIRR